MMFYATRAGRMIKSIQPFNLVLKNNCQFQVNTTITFQKCGSSLRLFLFWVVKRAIGTIQSFN